MWLRLYCCVHFCVLEEEDPRLGMHGAVLVLLLYVFGNG